MRGLLEGFAGRGFAEHGTEEAIAELGRAVAAFRKAAEGDDRAALVSAKTNFYAVLTEGAGNVFVKQLLTTLHNRITLLRVTSMTQEGRLKDSVAEIEDIYHAIASRDGGPCRGHLPSPHRQGRRSGAGGALGPEGSLTPRLTDCLIGAKPSARRQGALHACARIRRKTAMSTAPLTPPATIALIGLGQMGFPWRSGCCGPASPCRRRPRRDGPRRLYGSGRKAFAGAAEAAEGAGAVITMLPNGKVVRDVLLGSGGVAARLAKGALVIDMSSSAPTDTTSLAADLAQLGLALVDAPVSGGVKRAIDGSLAIMAGGPEDAVERARPVLAAMGKSIFATGPVGSGHAMKALNNYVSAAGLIAACEALLVGGRFGLQPETIVDVLNASTGRNNSTEVKIKPFVISEAFNSGFSLALMAKDLRIAADLADHLDLPLPQIQSVATLWEAAKAGLEPGADHTEIHRHLRALASRAESAA